MKSPAVVSVTLLALVLVWAMTASADTDPVDGAEDARAAVTPVPLATAGDDTVRTNLQVALALMDEALSEVMVALPAPPAAVVLVPGSTKSEADLLTNLATSRLRDAGYTVHLDMAPDGTDTPVLELRYRVEDLRLAYPRTGRRLLFFKSWVGRRMDLALQVTAVDRHDGQVLVSRRVVTGYTDRFPTDHLEAVQSPTYDFTQADLPASSTSRRLEQVVVLGALAGLAAIYFANTE
jgi:hypothetical protein